ncbi:MAG: hypothetical protein ACFHX7_18075 [Pseudomonadota bacterium]
MACFLALAVLLQGPVAMALGCAAFQEQTPGPSDQVPVAAPMPDCHKTPAHGMTLPKPDEAKTPAPGLNCCDDGCPCPSLQAGVTPEFLPWLTSLTPGGLAGRRVIYTSTLAGLTLPPPIQ